MNVGTRRRTLMQGIPGIGLSFRMPLGAPALLVLFAIVAVLGIVSMFQPCLVKTFLHAWQPSCSEASGSEDPRCCGTGYPGAREMAVGAASPGGEAVGPRHCPRLRRAGVASARQQLAGLEEAVGLGKRHDTVSADAAHEMVRSQLTRMVEAGGRDQFRQSLDGLSI